MFCATEAAVISQKNRTPNSDFAFRWYISSGCTRGTGFAWPCAWVKCRQSFIRLTLCELRKDPRENNKYQPVFKLYWPITEKGFSNFIFPFETRFSSFILRPSPEYKQFITFLGGKLRIRKARKLRNITLLNRTLSICLISCAFIKILVPVCAPIRKGTLIICLLHPV